MAAPSGLVAFFLTDIEGSSRLWETHPEGMRRALAEHDRLLRQAIASHDGHIFATAGDLGSRSLSRGQRCVEGGGGGADRHVGSGCRG